MSKFARRAGRTSILPVLLTASWLSAAAHADEAKSDSESKSKSPATVKIDGVFESPKAVEVKPDTEEIQSLKIKRIVPHGTSIEQGRNVVWFETEEVDKRIRDTERELRLAEVALRESEFKHEQFLEAQQLDREAAERTRERARQDHDHFVRVDRDYQVKSAEFSRKNAEFSLANAEEELEQLRKMYREDDLTEESEEIVLKRAEQAVENARFRLEGTENQTTRSIEQLIPRTEVDQEAQLRRAEMAYETKRRELEFARKRRELELDGQRKKFAEQLEDFEELREERDRLVIAAPTAGIVFHGPLNRGAVGDKPSELEPGKSVSADQVIATIVPPRPLRVRLTVPEEHLRHVGKGDRVQVTPNSLPEQSLRGTVRSIATVPYAAGKFDCLVTVNLNDDAERIRPGMGCSVEFETDEVESEPGDDSEKDKSKKDKSKDGDDKDDDESKKDDSKDDDDDKDEDDEDDTDDEKKDDDA